MLSVAERPAGCMMYIKDVMYIIQPQQVQHNRHALLLTPHQQFQAYPTQLSAQLLLIIAQPACVAHVARPHMRLLR